MTWNQLSINRPHLAYIILGGFTSLFMLCSSFIKERLYLGEAAVATICGIIFGPHAANLFNPGSWGNVDQITLECSRIVLVVQCFAVGVELPRAYMERHWRSVVFLLLPVMTFGWLMTSLFIWWMIPPLSWLEALCCAACVTATDPVLASSVVGKGKFAKRVPKHLRDVLSAESGCNDGMAFPFIYLSLYLIHYRPDANEVSFHWFVLTILYECVFGAIYGFIIGYLGRHAIKWAEQREMVDRESFLVFYFVLALFCAGSGSILGIDDLLVGFSAGVGFSNDGWFLQKTEESHVSNVIDLLLNLAYFVYFGSIIPWEQYNAPAHGTTPWRLVVIALFVIFFRRIPIMMALKPVIPDIKTWREALFAGHFGPIGVGAIFAAILARAELETDSTTPLAKLPPPGSPNYALEYLIWPITTFLVVSSILVHGSSIAVFTLGKHINTLTITMSYTQANEEGPSWMNRLPRISSQAKSSMSMRRPDDTDSSVEKLSEIQPGTLGPIGLPGNFLRRQKEEEYPTHDNRSSSLRPLSRRRRRDVPSMGPGGPISQSAIMPMKRQERSPSDTAVERSDESTPHESESPQEDRSRRGSAQEEELEAYQEGDEIIIEDEEGNVLKEQDERGRSEREKEEDVKEAGEEARKEGDVEHGVSRAEHEKHEHIGPALEHAMAKETNKDKEEIKQEVQHHAERVGKPNRSLKEKWEDWKRSRTGDGEAAEHKRRRGPALAYQFGNTIIVEDEDGEVVKKYSIPGSKQAQAEAGEGPSRQALQRMGTWVGMNKKEKEPDPESKKERNKRQQAEDDARIRFTVTAGGERMTKGDFIKQISQLDPKARARALQQSDAPEHYKDAALRKSIGDAGIAISGSDIPAINEPGSSSTASGDGTRHAKSGTAAQRRREAAAATRRVSAGVTPPSAAAQQGYDSDDDGTERVPPRRRRDEGTAGGEVETPSTRDSAGREPETAAERRRREAALGVSTASGEEDSEDDDTERVPPSSYRASGPSAGSRGEGPGGSGSGSGSGSGTPSSAPSLTEPEPVHSRRQTNIRFADDSNNPPSAWSANGNSSGSRRWGPNRSRR
ncbi:hypothetical protein L228DRAFT_206937 [Xylona heveae TC161]|uniref:Na+/H+ antiporter n=1 Tax=Xylona heveae (strain CBS 132557 / TC161) TaxID=1328760 RepID=A0A165K367_XYLHT|nr:hypothetical protein L228DRAFT_206937 [Xylona heveae TC161]KZF26933.1 hypothetical protein L228DRAFT_206937 [Xylona heveae TC161]